MGMDWLMLEFFESLSIDYSQLDHSLKKEITSNAEQALIAYTALDTFMAISSLPT